MNVHAYEKLWLAGAMVLIVVFIVTITYGSVGLGIAMISADQEPVDPNALSEHDRFGDPGVTQVGENEYEVAVISHAFFFEPGSAHITDPIEVPANSEVTFYVTSSDVIHSFNLVGTNVNTMVIPGEVSEMTVEFDEPAEYGIVCNEYCGSQHHLMEGIVHVVPEDEFDLTEVAVDVDDVDATDADAAATFEITVENGLLSDLETTVDLAVGEETVSEPVTVPGEGSETVTISVDADALEEGNNEWTVTVDGHEETGQVTVESATDEDEDEDGGDTDD